MEAVLMVGYTLDGISNQEQTRWLTCSSEGGLRGFDLARKSWLEQNYGTGASQFPFPSRQGTRTGAQSTSKPASIIRAQQTEEAYPDVNKLRRELEKIQKEWDQAILERTKPLWTGTKPFDRDNAICERNMLKAELEQTRKLQETTASREQPNSELESLQRRQQKAGSGKERKRRGRQLNH